MQNLRPGPGRFANAVVRIKRGGVGERLFNTTSLPLVRSFRGVRG